jgi:hypothetical protein
MRSLGLLVIVTVLALLVTLAARVLSAEQKKQTDFICFWTAGNLIANGQSPYDSELQTQLQERFGWDKVEDGRGIFPFLPFYYPYWFGMFFALLVPMGYSAAKTTWLFLNAWMLFDSGVQARGLVPGVPRRIPPVLISAFFLSIVTLLVGQTTILILFLIIVAWKLMEQGRDLTGGMILAGVATKPQLAAVLILGVLLWAARQRRWRIVTGFFVGLAILCLGSSLFLPSWPIRMLEAMRRTAPPTEHFPWIGASWLLILKLIGLRSWLLWISYLALAVPMFLMVLAAALDRARPLRETIALGILAAFFIAPYGRHYDYPILLIPLLVLLGCRLSEKWGTALLVAVVFLPYLQFGFLIRYQNYAKDRGDFVYESTYFWIPMILLSTWLATGWRPRPSTTTPPSVEGGATPSHRGPVPVA